MRTRTRCSMLAPGRILGSLTAVFIVVTTTREAAAQDARGFGEKHQLILTADRLMPLLSYTTSTASSQEGGQTREVSDSGTSVAFLFGREPGLGVVHTLPRIAMDFTIVKRLTIGGAFAVAFGLGGTHENKIGNSTAKQDTPTTSIVGFAPRVGYVLPLGHNFAFWPRLGFAFYAVSSKTEDVNNGNLVKTTDSTTLLSLDLDPQFAWMPIEHFFFHFGPIANIPITGSQSTEIDRGASSTTQKNDLSVFHFGLSAGLGGWFDL